jgi:hypothetical protein
MTVGALDLDLILFGALIWLCCLDLALGVLMGVEGGEEGREEGVDVRRFSDQ